MIRTTVVIGMAVTDQYQIGAFDVCRLETQISVARPSIIVIVEENDLIAVNQFIGRKSQPAQQKYFGIFYGRAASRGQDK